MNERGTGVLEQYGLEVYRTCRARGAVFCETSCGPKLLKEWTGTDKRILLEYEVLSAISGETGLQVDCCMKNLEGNLISVDEDQTRYVLRDWYEGRECNTRETGEILAAAKLLAKLHQGFRTIEEKGILEKRQEQYLAEEKERLLSAEVSEEGDGKEEERTPLLLEFPTEGAEPLAAVLEKHNKELKRARNYVKGRKRKTDFELVVIGGFEKFYRQAEEAAMLSEEAKNALENRWCHGEYSYHHVLLGNGTSAVTDFSRLRRDVQVTDLYYFTRKILEKHKWNLRLGNQILDVYEENLPLEKEEWKYLHVLFLYPEKYWKQINYYVNSNKAWIPDRNVDKLRVLDHQFESRELFLKELKKRF